MTETRVAVAFVCEDGRLAKALERHLGKPAFEVEHIPPARATVSGDWDIMLVAAPDVQASSWEEARYIELVTRSRARIVHVLGASHLRSPQAYDFRQWPLPIAWHQLVSEIRAVAMSPEGNHRSSHVRFQPRLSLEAGALGTVEVLAPQVDVPGRRAAPVAREDFALERTIAAMEAARSMNWSNKSTSFVFNLPELRYRPSGLHRALSIINGWERKRRSLVTFELNENSVAEERLFQVISERVHAAGARLALTIPAQPDMFAEVTTAYWCDELIVPPAVVNGVLASASIARYASDWCEAADRYGLDVTAVGIEDAPTAAWWRQAGARWGQGYFFCSPMSGSCLNSWLDNNYPST